MSVFKQTVSVNNGNTGWSRADVIDSLETVFANLGWHSGTAKNGVAYSISPPFVDYTTGGQTSWRVVNSESIVGFDKEDKTWSVVNNGSTAYTFTQTTGDNADPDQGVDGDQTGDNIDIVCNQGDVLTFNLNNSGHPFYIVWDNSNGYEAGTEIDGDYSKWPIYRGGESPRPPLSTTSILNIPSAQGAESGSVTWDTANVQNGEYYYVCGTHNVMKGKITINPNVRYAKSLQILDELDVVSNYNDFALYNSVYQYGSYYQPLRTGPHRMWWDYTVPADGNRSALELRIFRGGFYTSTSSQYEYLFGHVTNICVLNAEQTYGWQEGDSFTIPGTATGGSSPTHDIVVGDPFSAARVCYLNAKNLGAGTTFYDKYRDGAEDVPWGILRLEHDNTKRFGHTYWSFFASNNNNLYLKNGWDWEIANTAGWYYGDAMEGPGNSVSSYTTNNSNSRFTTPGHWAGGRVGVDFSYDAPNIRSSGNAAYTLRVPYCRSTDPTSYPIDIRVYRAQSPQDSNFAIIQFTQTVNENVETFGTFALQKGTGWGQGIWSLDHQFQGGLLRVFPSGNEEIWTTLSGQITYGGYYVQDSESQTADYTRRRECLWGYERDLNYEGPVSEGSKSGRAKYASNIYEDNDEYTSSEIVMYFRDRDLDMDADNISYLDRPGYYTMDESGYNYLKVMKSLPVVSNWAPCPYYLPDDFVMIQFIYDVGEIDLQTGDTVKISDTEKYEVIIHNYENNVNIPGYTTANNASKGLIFAARIV